MTGACHPDRRTSFPCPKEVDQYRTIRQSHEEGFASFIGTSKMEGLVKREAMMIFPCYRHRRREMNHETKRPTGICKPHKEEYIIYSHFTKKIFEKGRWWWYFPVTVITERRWTMGTSPQVYVKPEGIYNDGMTGGELVTFPVTSPTCCKKSYSSQ